MKKTNQQTTKQVTISRKYYDILHKDRSGVEIRSKRTNQYWRIVVTDCPSEGACIIYHKHHYNHPYHTHAKAKSFEAAMSIIIGHDRYNAEDKRYRVA